MHGKNSEEFFTHAWAYSETPSYPLFLLLKLTYNICCYFSIVNSLVLDSNFCPFLNQLSSSLLLEKSVHYTPVLCYLPTSYLSNKFTYIPISSSEQTSGPILLLSAVCLSFISFIWALYFSKHWTSLS